ncbi:MAG TPA: amidohydrolase family protein [Aridibacter sp.]|nr:amidohydrolase family protein [Aridibacter sp.]
MRNAIVPLFIFLLSFAVSAQRTPLPIIDMHLHAKDAPQEQRLLCIPVTVYGIIDPKCPNPMKSPLKDTELVNQSVEVMNRRNMFGVIGGKDLQTIRRFAQAAPDRLIPAYDYEFGDEKPLSIEALRNYVKSGDLKVLAEVLVQYSGVAPNDKVMEPLWKLAEELDVPVGLHLGEGYPGAPYLGDPSYRVRFGNPLLLEEVLVRHPKLRIYIMHYGSPMVDEMIAIMYTYPNVYIDIGGNTWPYPKEYFYSQLKKFVDAGFGKRIMFGSDQMYWPELIETSIEIVERAPFLTREQKRDIFYNNAATFLRFSKEEIRKHHGNQAPGN